MNAELKQKIVRNILNRLSSQKFEQWNGKGGQFDRWISGDLPKVTDAEIIKAVEELFLHDIP